MSSKTYPSTPEIILGTVQFGRFGNVRGRIDNFATVEDIKPILDTFQSHGHTKIDTARIYGSGFSEKLLAEAGYQARGLRIESKLYPTKSRPLGPQNVPYSHSPEDLRAGLLASLEALKATKIDTWYLYAPDRSVPYTDTLREVDKLHREGFFERWGLCNFPAWEVARIQELCAVNGWVKPAVYQGPYNLLLRSSEAELLPCLRHYGMAYECAQPMASGLLSGRFARDMDDSAHVPGSRFDPAHPIGRHCRDRYWHDAYFDAVDVVRGAAEPHGLTVTECAMRWLKYHSILKREFGDGIVLGTGSVVQLEELLTDLEKGPLPAEVARAIEEAWEKASSKPWQYHN